MIRQLYTVQTGCYYDYHLDIPYILDKNFPLTYRRAGSVRVSSMDGRRRCEDRAPNH